MKLLFITFFFTTIACAQVPDAPTDLKTLGTRTWIRLDWKDNANNEEGFKIFRSLTDKKPDTPEAIISANKTRCYLQRVKEETSYYVWVEAFNSSGSGKALSGNVTTVKKWVPDHIDRNGSDIPSSAAVPNGMQLFWNDEFNDELLNRNKWFTGYYSTIDFLKKENLQALLGDSLPQAAYNLNGHSIDLFVNDSLPVKPFADGKKISSIQTYDWSTNENLLDNSRGGYFEARVKRTFTGKPRGLNTAFWFDSPGPDLKYYLQEGTILNGTKGIRPKGQLFEIDIFEYMDAQFVMHGHVDSNGNFVHNLATDIAKGYVHKDNWVTHGLLWTPTSISHYINGKLIKAYNNKNQIYSPNHFMNVLLGSYGKGGSVSMEVDYIRGYHWPLEGKNELPNPGFEYGSDLLPWEGNGIVSARAGRNESNGVLLKPGQMIEQYVYLDNNISYQLAYWCSGKGILKVAVDDVTPVSGTLKKITDKTFKGKNSFVQHSVNFKTGKLYENQMKTIRVSFTNTGESGLSLDDITIEKK